MCNAQSLSTLVALQPLVHSEPSNFICQAAQPQLLLCESSRWPATLPLLLGICQMAKHLADVIAVLGDNDEV